MVWRCRRVTVSPSNMITITEIVNTNPLSSILMTVKSHHCTTDYGLERTYHLSKSNKVLSILRGHPAFNQDLLKIDHNVVLDLYPEHEYIFGPYPDVNEHETNLVYFLYTNRADKPNELKIIYAGRALLESIAGVQLGQDPRVIDVRSYQYSIASMNEVPNRRSVNCYYRDYVLSQEELAAARDIYKCRSVTQPRYNSLKETYAVGLNGGSSVSNVNAFRLLYEIYYEKGRLPKHIVTGPTNGRKADLRVDNITCRDTEAEDQERRRIVLEEFGLDTYALEKITAPTGFNRFKGIYIHDGPLVKPSMKGRRYIQVVKDGEDKPFAFLLSKALMMVKLGRLLTDEETVDHIDHDHGNDDIDNLRILDRATHASEDSVKLEISPCVCRGCGNTFTMGKKVHEYYRDNPYAPTCSPECKKKVGRGAPIGDPITYRYYVTDKLTGEPRYFQSLDYNECRQLLYKHGRAALSST